MWGLTHRREETGGQVIPVPSLNGIGGKAATEKGGGSSTNAARLRVKGKIFARLHVHLFTIPKNILVQYTLPVARHTAARPLAAGGKQNHRLSRIYEWACGKAPLGLRVIKNVWFTHLQVQIIERLCLASSALQGYLAH